MMPCSRETSAAMQLIVVASQVGTHPSRLAKNTGFPVEWIRSFSKLLRKAKIWKGSVVDAREWLDVSYDRQRITAILAQALVARGLSKREWSDEGAVYKDQRGNVIARFCRYEPFVDCLELLLKLEANDSQAVIVLGEVC
jgi:hypothetical protein